MHDAAVAVFIVSKNPEKYQWCLNEFPVSLGRNRTSLLIGSPLAVFIKMPSLLREVTVLVSHSEEHMCE